MTLSSDLLVQAQFLVGREPKRPKQASLRRAISAAYYSLFHLLTEDATRAMFRGSGVADLRPVVRRAFQHASMKKAARGFGSGELAEPWKSLLGRPSRDLQLVASAFVDLQQERHQAEYDLGRPVTRPEATDLVERAAAAITTWKAIRRMAPGSKAYSFEAQVFLAALLFHEQVSRR